jgi:hypothetical protein
VRTFARWLFILSLFVSAQPLALAAAKRPAAPERSQQSIQRPRGERFMRAARKLAARIHSPSPFSREPLVTWGNPLALLPKSLEGATRIAFLGSAAPENTFEQKLVENLMTLGRNSAQNGDVVLYGACPGAPEIVARSAHDEGGWTIGISPARSLAEHKKNPNLPVKSMSIMMAAGTGDGIGLIEREAPLIHYSDILVYVNGRSGTLGELTAGMYEPKVIALLEESGGVAGGAKEHILPFTGHGRAVVVADSDPLRLLEKAREALAQLRLPEGAAEKAQTASRAAQAGRTAWPADLPPMTRKRLLNAKRAAKSDVFVFLGHEKGLDAADRKNVDRLADLIATPAKEGRERVLVVPTRESAGLSSQVAQRVRGRGIRTIGISPAGSVAEHVGAGYAHQGLAEIQLTGTGPGTGVFASYRDVVSPAKAVFVAGGDHETLAATIFAMYLPTVIGVLETESSLAGKLRREIFATFDKPSAAKMIYDTDPVRLYERVMAASRELANGPRIAIQREGE